MSDPTTVTAMTNPTPKSCVEVKCDCNTMWSLAQQFSNLRLSKPTGENEWQLLESYSARARRIAATYARFYLEQEEHCDPSKKGRFYWMALGAFASKTVACTLESWQVKAQAATVSETVKEGLGMGNFWLFCDISGWHWYYCISPGSFEMCVGSRDATQYVPMVKAQVKNLPWSAKALPKIKNLKVSKEIKTGFQKVRAFEKETKDKKRSNIQLENLLAIADHEQGVILQPLIYEDPEFVWWLDKQRWSIVKKFSPSLEVVFGSACKTNEPAFKSVAPGDLIMENFQSRMKWIAAAANQFHGLMQLKKSKIEAELHIIAGWVNAAV